MYENTHDSRNFIPSPSIHVWYGMVYIHIHTIHMYTCIRYTNHNSFMLLDDEKNIEMAFLLCFIFILFLYVRLSLVFVYRMYSKHRRIARNEHLMNFILATLLYIIIEKIVWNVKGE